MGNSIIRGQNLVKIYDGERVVDNIDFGVKSEEFLTILGPSGCGKTTTLRMLGGFEMPTEGNILFEGRVITNVPPYERPINTVFQKYALFPHLNIYENIAFGLRIKKLKEHDIRKRVGRMLELVNLTGFENRSVNSLSGGQQQRIAIARALVNEPKVLLLDEPLGALDLKLRKEMQLELKYMQQDLGITFIYVTHDQEEALTMSDKIIVMNNGRIQQIGSPVSIYNEPINAFVADFIGESNLLTGVMKEDYYVEFADRVFSCLDKGFEKNEAVDVVVRPEDIKIVASTDGMLAGKVDSVIFKGVHYEMVVLEGPREWLIHSTVMAPEDSEVGLRITPDDIHIMKKMEPSPSESLGGLSVSMTHAEAI
jgi:spermidine/putrescine transport system ATP-binding protein